MATKWSEIAPGKSAELNSTFDPSRASAWVVNGANTPTQSNWPLANAAAADAVGRPWNSMSSSVRPSSARPCSSRKWSTTPGSAAIDFPARSATVPIEASQMIASLPVELSLVRKMRCSLPAATPKIVSFSVCVLTSMLPATRASSEAM